MILGLDVFWPEVGKILGFLGVSSDSRQPNRPNRVPVFLGSRQKCVSDFLGVISWAIWDEILPGYIGINHDIRIPSLNNQALVESKAVFFSWFMYQIHVYIYISYIFIYSIYSVTVNCVFLSTTSLKLAKTYCLLLFGLCSVMSKWAMADNFPEWQAKEQQREGWAPTSCQSLSYDS